MRRLNCPELVGDEGDVRRLIPHAFSHVLLTGTLETDANPYSPPNSARDIVATSYRWRLIPATLIGSLGALSFGIGAYFAAVVILEVFTNGLTSFVVESPIAIAFYMGPGVSWISSGLLLWKSKYVYAIVLTLAGLAVPVTLASLFAP